MQNENKKIGDLYREAFKDAQWDSNQDDQEWNAIAYELEKKRFFRFSWTRFNVYYSSLIVLSFLLLFFLLVRKAIEIKGETTKKVHKSENVVFPDSSAPPKPSQEYSDASSPKASSATESLPVNQTQGTRPNNSEQNIVNQLNTRNTTLITDSSSFSNSTQLLVSVPKDSTEKPIAQTIPQKKPKKIVYITRQDTITVVDTLKTTKSRRRR